MLREVAKAHVDTLLEWADQYDRHEVGDGAAEIAFLMRRTARLIAAQAGLSTAAPPPAEEQLPKSIDGALREG